MFDKLFGRKKKTETPPIGINFGRYSDNNKPLIKVNRWTGADGLFKEKKYAEGFDAFFDYLRDDQEKNVTYERDGATGTFSFYQGSKIVRGKFDAQQLSAEVTLARMPQPSVPVMRRLLEMNFQLYYSRFALDGDRLCMRFDSKIEAANPSKLYYGLKELSTRADKQDDLLVQDFTMLQSVDNEHVVQVPVEEKEIKFSFFRQQIQETLDAVAAVDPEKFSGGVSYMLLSLVYRLDYLVTPEGKLLSELEKIAAIYFRKDERPATDKNRDMIEEFRKLLLKEKEEIFQNLFRSKYTFSIVAPQAYKSVTDSIHSANQSMAWYRDNNHPFIASRVAEYGIAYCQYSYSLPKVITELFHLFMEVNYGAYFASLGYDPGYYNATTAAFDQEALVARITTIQQQWKEKYPLLGMNLQNLRFDTLVNFNFTYTNELEFLNMELKA